MNVLTLVLKVSSRPFVHVIVLVEDVLQKMALGLGVHLSGEKMEEGEKNGKKLMACRKEGLQGKNNGERSAEEVRVNNSWLQQRSRETNIR